MTGPADLQEADRILAAILHTQFDSKAVYDINDSYFEGYREALYKLLRFQPHETQDNPLLCECLLFCRLINLVYMHTYIILPARWIMMISY